MWPTLSDKSIFFLQGTSIRPKMFMLASALIFLLRIYSSPLPELGKEKYANGWLMTVYLRVPEPFRLSWKDLSGINFPPHWSLCLLLFLLLFLNGHINPGIHGVPQPIDIMNFFLFRFEFLRTQVPRIWQSLLLVCLYVHVPFDLGLKGFPSPGMISQDRLLNGSICIVRNISQKTTTIQLLLDHNQMQNFPSAPRRGQTQG
jgi:hypothetical protein